MQKLPFRFPTVVILAVLLLADSSCSKQSKEARHLRKADGYFTEGKYDAAEIEYINVLQLDPRNPDALGRLGSIYLDQGRAQSAFAYLSEAATLKPDDIEVERKLAQIQMAFGKLVEAKKGLNHILDQNPLDSESPLLLVQTARSRAESETVRKRLQELPASAQQGAPLLVALGTIDFHEHDFDGAAAAFARALSVDPKSSEADTALAHLYVAENDKAKAETAFAEAARLSPVHSPKQLEFAEFETRIGNIENAKKILDAITQNTPDYLPAWVVLAQIAEQQKAFDQGLADIGKVLAIDPDNPGALLENARLKVAKGDITDAVSGLESAAKYYPKSPQFDLELGRAYLAAGDTDKAELSLRRAITVAPDLSEAQMMLAGLQARKGDIPGAIAQLRALVHAHPDAVQAQMLLGEALRTHGDFDEAISIFQQLSASNPKDFRPQMMLGTIYAQQHQAAKARVAFEKVRAIAPDFVPALERLVDMDIAVKDFDGAHRLISNQVAKQPKDGSLQLLLAKEFMARRDAAGIETALKRAIELQPDGTKAYSLLAELYLSTNRQSEALADLQSAVAKNPRNTDALMLIAAIQDRQKDYTSAKTSYEKILEINPSSIPSLNNLAYLYAERLKDLEKAHELAEKAHRMVPNEPHVADTLGWILYRQQKFTNALALLKDSADKLPTEAEVQYHMGMTAYMLGQEDLAKEALHRSLDLSSVFPGNEEARSRVAILEQEPGKGGAAQRLVLEKAIAEQKDDPVAMSRLGALYEADGSIDKAIDIYQDALKASPENATVLSSLTRIYVSKNESAKAIEYGRRARKLAPDDPQLAHVLGQAAYQTGDFPWSLSLLQEAVRGLGDNPEVHFDLGRSFYSEGNVADAESQIKSALQLSPDFGRSEEAKSFIQMIDLSADPTRAAANRPIIQQYLIAHPDNAAGMMAAAAAEEASGDQTDAQTEYEKILGHLPDFSPAMRRLAIIYSKNGNNDKAAFEIAVKAKAAFPDDASVAQALGIIDFRRGDYINAKSLFTDAVAQNGDDPELNFYLGMADVKLRDDQGAKAALHKALAGNLGIPESGQAREELNKLK